MPINLNIGDFIRGRIEAPGPIPSQNFTDNTPEQPSVNTHINVVNKTQASSINQSNKGISEASSEQGALDRNTKSPTDVPTDTDTRWSFTDLIKKAATARVTDIIETRTGITGLSEITGQSAPQANQPSPHVPNAAVPQARAATNPGPQVEGNIAWNPPQPQRPSMPQLNMPKFK